MRSTMIFAVLALFVAVASATYQCPDIADCRCSHSATREWAQDSNGCWYCYCIGEPSTANPTDPTTTNTMAPTNAPKKITNLRNQCVQPVDPDTVEGTYRYQWRPLREGESANGRFTAWIRPRVCANGAQCFRVRDCKQDQPCSVMEYCTSSNDPACVGLKPIYCGDIPADYDCNEDGIADIMQPHVEVIEAEGFAGKICAWVKDPEMPSDLFVKRFTEMVDYTTSDYNTVLAGASFVVRNTGSSTLSYNFKFVPDDNSDCANINAVISHDGTDETVVSDVIFKEDGCRFKIKVADNDVHDNNPNSNIVKLRIKPAIMA